MYYLFKVKEKIKHNKERKKEGYGIAERNGFQKKRKIYLTNIFAPFSVLAGNISSITRYKYIISAFDDKCVRIFRHVCPSLKYLYRYLFCRKERCFQIIIWQKSLDWWLTIVCLFQMSLPFEIELLGAD